MQDLIVILEDEDRRVEAMRQELQRLIPQTEVVFIDNAPDMIAWLEENLAGPRLICLDHDLGPNRQRDGRVFDPGVGRDVADFLAMREPSCPILIHSTNVDGAYGMQFALEDAGWSVERVIPFGDLEWVKTDWTGRVEALIGRSHT